MITLYRLALAPEQKPYRKGLLFTHNNGDFDANFVTERGCDAPSSKVERHIPDRFCTTLKINIEGVGAKKTAALQ